MDETLELLDALERLYQGASLETKRAALSEGAPAPTLFVRFDLLGRGERAVDLAFSFVPLPADATATGVRLLQSMAELPRAVEACPADELRWMLGRINLQLPIGHFGVVDETGAIYFKHNSLVDTRAGVEVNARLVDRQSGLMLHSLGLFMDGVLDAAEGKLSARQALEQNPFAELLLGRVTPER